MITPKTVPPKVYSVSQLNSYVKSLLDGDPVLDSVFVSCEISNLKNNYSSGHYYFSIKDSASVMSAVMFSFNVRKLKFAPQDGMKVIARGKVSLYSKSGSYQINVEDMYPDGIGALTMAYEQLKKKLEAQGLFSAEHKKPIPNFPSKVGVITSPTGAVIRDIRNVISRRFPMTEIVLLPVLVQGDGAAPQLISAVNEFNNEDNVDVIIIGRGGGSIEDLWPFNDENLAYAIFASHIPVISAVGHETDFTICDFVADLRAPTPSAAAELAVPDVRELRARYDYLNRLSGEIVRSRLGASMSGYKNTARFMQKAYELKISRRKLLYLNISKSAEALSDKRFTAKREEIRRLGDVAEELNPVKLLNRGYSVVSKNNKTVNSVEELKSGDKIDIRLSDGEVSAKVD